MQPLSIPESEQCCYLNYAIYTAVYVHHCTCADNQSKPPVWRLYQKYTQLKNCQKNSLFLDFEYVFAVTSNANWPDHKTGLQKWWVDQWDWWEQSWTLSANVKERTKTIFRMKSSYVTENAPVVHTSGWFSFCMSVTELGRLVFSSSCVMVNLL